MVKKNPTPYKELNSVLSELVSGIQQLLGDELIGTYLQGSFAVGDFDEHSDVDFVMVIQEELKTDQVNALQGMHGKIFELASQWAHHLEGSYFPSNTLRQASLKGTDLWYLDNGARTLIRSSHCNSLLVRWVVREQGVTLCGPPPKTLVDAIPEVSLISEIFETLIHWGQQILDNPSPFRNRFYQGFIVLSYCRMLHDILTGHPGSKRQGAEWAKKNLDPKWAGLIDRAWLCRPIPERQIKEPPDPNDFNQTLNFVSHIMSESQKRFAGRG